MKKMKTFAMTKTIIAEKAPACLEYAIGRPKGADAFNLISVAPIRF